ncbi:hypothetical protein ACJMK2_003097 [Sinanodonta woodiana]|uniref:ATP-dependent DNA helicase II subunit 2 n=1 Tax=Sinanodonta woodiana TaxID=1069815 RepID=A0ABD3XZ44_SINWO
MAATKEAIAIVLDVGPSMNQAPPGEATALQTALDGITMILQRKMFAESKDEICLVLFGTPDTDNPLADGGSYENITIARPLGIPDFDFLQSVQNDIQASNVSGDFIDAIVVAMDHLVNAVQGKKGFASKRLILLTDLGGGFGDDKIDTIVAGIINSETELNVIGPSLDDDDEEGGAGASAMPNGHQKVKTPQQRAGQAMLRHILQQVDGECYSFSEALPALSYFQTRQIRQTAWKCQLEIGSMQIPICGYTKVKEFKLKQSWKRVYARDPDLEVGTLRTQHKNDEEETEVEKEDMVEGHRYGNTLVPMSEDDKENMKYKAEKCFKVLGFTKSENIKRQHFQGDGVMAVVAEKGDETAGVALSAVINALYETNTVAIARRVYNAASSPRIGCLIPHIKADYECLYWFDLPFMEDIRQYTFGSLPVKDETPANKKFAPTGDQLAAIDNLIDSMDLGQAAEDEDGEKTEAMKPKLTFNPYFQRLYQCMQHRALSPDDPLPELSPIVANSLKPPQEVIAACEQSIKKLPKLFKLEVVKKKDQKTGGDIFKEDEGGDAGPAVKRRRTDASLEGGMKDIARAKVTEVGTTSPVEDFLTLINSRDEDKFEQACEQMQKRIKQLVVDSFGDQFYEKAMDCLKTLRKECVKKSEPRQYNTFVKQFKEMLIAKARRDFWEKIVINKQGLIPKSECEDSNVTKDEAQKFVQREEKEDEEMPTDEDEDEDLLDEL